MEGFIFNDEGFAVEYVSERNVSDDPEVIAYVSNAMVEWYNNLGRESATRTAKRQMMLNNDYDSRVISTVATRRGN